MVETRGIAGLLDIIHWNSNIKGYIINPVIHIG